MSEIAERPAAGTPITARSILIVLCSTLGTAAYAFMWNSVNVALPHMQGAFSATTDQVAWVMIAFVIGSAMTTASVGWLATRFGRKRVFLSAVVGFTVTLVGCGTAGTLETEVFWRFLQGVFGAALLPMGQAIAVNAFPPDRHGQATSLWALGFVSANVISPTLAGQLIEEFGWQWIFFANVPIAIAVFFSTLYLVPKSPTDPRRLDWLGLGSLLLGASVLQLMLARGERLDWFESTEIIIEAVIAGLFLYIFIVHTFTAKNPFVDRLLITDWNYVLGSTFIFVAGSVLFLPLLLMPLLLQQIGGYSAVNTGDLLLWRGVGSVAGLVIMSRFRDKVDPRPILFLGIGLTAYSAWTVSNWTTDIREIDVIYANLIQGVATAGVWAPLNTLALSKLDKRVQDQGFAMFYLAFDIGSAIGTAAVVGLHARYIQINHAVLGERITPFSDVSRFSPLLDNWSIDSLSGVAALQQEVARQANMIAFNNAFLTVTITLVILIPFILLFRHRPVRLHAS